VAKLPHGLIVAANRADGDIDSLMTDIDFEEILQYVTEEKNLDIIAGTPSSTEAMSRLIDDSMQRQIFRLNRDVRIFQKIADANPALDIKIKYSGEVINSKIAEGRLMIAMNDLAQYRKLLSEKTKAEAGEGVQVNVQNNFSIQEMMTAGLKRIETELDT